MTKASETREEELSTRVSRAMDDLPILARVEFVKNIIFDRGGSRDSYPHDETLVIATDVLDGVVEILRKNRVVAQFRGDPEP